MTAISGGVAAQRHDQIHPARQLLRMAAVAIAYWAAARLSLNLALVNGQVTPIWPPSGIALVAYLLLGRGIWPSIAIAAFAVNLPIGPSPPGAALIAGGDTLAPLFASELLRRVGFHRQLDRMRDAIAIIGLGALVGMTFSATVGTAVLTLSGKVPVGRAATTFAVWWAGDVMGVLLVAPMLLSLIPRPGARPLGWRGSAELTALLAGIGVVTYFLFESHYRIEYLVLPLIAIAAWRFRLAGAAPAALIASVIGGWAAVNSVGPFASETTFEKMVTLQAFNISVSLGSFLLAAYADGRQQREEMFRMFESASAAITAKTDAVSVAAHELGPPVALLTSYLEVLSQSNLGPAPPKWHSILRVMADKAWQIDRIIKELVDAAQIEGKAQTQERAHLDFRDAVERAVKRARPRLDVSGGEIETKLGTEPLPVDADPRQIGRILDNLINNSLTYTLRPARVKLDAAEEGKRVVLRVTDNGIGMSPAERARVFQPFHRTKDPAFSHVPGTGLGLYASRKLAEANQGNLTLERTKKGLGSCFVLDLPVATSNYAREEMKRQMVR